MDTYRDAVLFENPNLKKDWKRAFTHFTPMRTPERIPPGITQRVEDEAFFAFRAAKDLACVDSVICARRKEDNEPVVLLSKRNMTEGFGGCWWIYGGSLGAYQPVWSFIVDRVRKECGVAIEPQAFIGLYRTCAADRIQSTLQPCYVAKAPHAILAEKMRTDPNHDSARFFTRDELKRIPEVERHWYPMRVAERALRNMP